MIENGISGHKSLAFPILPMGGLKQNQNNFSSVSYRR
jgi:hypothetical protein